MKSSGGTAPAVRGGARKSALRIGLCGVLGLWAAALTTPAVAQPTVRVRAASNLVLDGVRDGRIRGRLQDDFGAPLAERVVVLDIVPQDGSAPSRRVAARSLSDGTFTLAVGAFASPLRVHAMFSGDREHASASLDQSVDPERADVQLRFVEPRSAYVDLDETSHSILARASSELGAAGIAITVRDEAQRVLGQGTTDAEGGFRLELSAKQLGREGPGRLELHAAGDAARNAASATMQVVRFRRTGLSLQLREVDGDKTLSGALQTAAGGLPEKAVGLFDGALHIATVLTDGTGRFAFDLRQLNQEAVAARTLQAHVRFESDAAWLGSSRSRVLSVPIAPPSTPSAWWLLLPSLLLGIAALWLSRGEQRDDAEAAPLLAAGIHANRRSAPGVAHHDVGGWVRDARNGRAIPGARVSLESVHGVRTVIAGGDGRFAIAGLAAGAFRMHATADGYDDAGTELAIPHRGQWADVQVQLSSLRDRAVDAYRPAGLRGLPSAELWGQWTAGQILENAARSGRATPALRRVTGLFEHAAYGAATPKREQINEIERASEQALDPFARGNSE